MNGKNNNPPLISETYENKTTYDIIKELKQKAELLVDDINGHEEDIKKAYKKSCHVYRSYEFDKTGRYGDNDYSELIEQALPETIRELLLKVINSLDDIKSINIDNTRIITCRIKDLIIEYLDNLQMFFNEHEDVESLYDIINYRIWIDQYKTISLLSKFANIDKNIILIGTNGSGKTTLAQILKGNDFKRISVIPAQKSLFFTTDSAILSSRRSDIESELLKNSIEFSKAESDYGFYEHQKYQFSRMLIAMRENYSEYLIKCREQGKSPKEGECTYDKVKAIIKKVFKNIDIKFGESFDKYIYCIRDGNEYSINGLSEGEKAALYYSLSVLMAPDNSFVVVDEPETYLNPSLANKVWDIILKERRDCQFIFITHSVNFILSRNGFETFWIKEFVYPDHYTFERIDDGFKLPKSLMTEILGSKTPILFCEGDNKDSLDYKVYSALLQDSYTVIPVGNHKRVIDYCKVLNNADWIGIEAIGIIDGDLRDKNQIEKLKKIGIYTLPFNEIEMFLLSEDVMIYTIRGSHPKEYRNNINAFKKKFWEFVTNEKEKIILDKVRNEVNERLESQKIVEYDKLSDLENQLNNIMNIDVNKMYKEEEGYLETVIVTKNYDELLRICNSKKKISRELANKYLDSNYEEKSIERISEDISLQKLLIDKYLTDLKTA